MGRAKLKMEYIMKEKSRHLTFRKRKEGLIKKIKEFATLCDVSACMIIYGPEDRSTRPLIWPENLYEVERIINIYRSKKKDCENRGVGLADFLKDKSKKIAEEVSKLKEANMENSNYSTSIEFLNYISESQLREFSSELMGKLDCVYSKIEMLKLNGNGYLVPTPETTSLFDQFRNGRFLEPYANNNNNNNNNSNNTSYWVHRDIEFDLANSYQQPIFSLNPFETIQENQQSLNNPNSMRMMMLKNNGNDYMQFGGLSDNMHCYPIYYEQPPSSASSYDVNNLLQDDCSCLNIHFPPMMHQHVSPYMQFPPNMNMLPSLPVPPPLNSLQDNHGGDFDYQYQVRDSKPKY